MVKKVSNEEEQSILSQTIDKIRKKKETKPESAASKNIELIVREGCIEDGDKPSRISSSCKI